jgi:hypothetical protein
LWLPTSRHQDTAKLHGKYQRTKTVLQVISLGSEHSANAIPVFSPSMVSNLAQSTLAKRRWRENLRRKPRIVPLFGKDARLPRFGVRPHLRLRKRAHRLAGKLMLIVQDSLSQPGNDK